MVVCLTTDIQAENLQVNRDLLNLRTIMTGQTAYRLSAVAAIALILATGWTQDCLAQKRKKDRRTEKVTVEDVRRSMQSGSRGKTEDLADGQGSGSMAYFVEEGDTIYYDTITASKVYSRIPRQKGKDWRQYYRLVHNFSKAYPYALVARKLVIEADSTIAADRLRGAKRERYINKVQAELFEVFEGQMRKLTVSQGALIMKLVDREVGKSSYNIIKGYKSSITAGFWQGIAKIFGSDLKKPYDPEGEDKEVEELVQMWHSGDFPVLYWSLFWKDPPEMPIPEKYR